MSCRNMEEKKRCHEEKKKNRRRDKMKEKINRKGDANKNKRKNRKRDGREKILKKRCHGREKRYWKRTNSQTPASLFGSDVSDVSLLSRHVDKPSLAGITDLWSPFKSFEEDLRIKVEFETPDPNNFVGVCECVLWSFLQAWFFFDAFQKILRKRCHRREKKKLKKRCHGREKKIEREMPWKRKKWKRDVAEEPKKKKKKKKKKKLKKRCCSAAWEASGEISLAVTRIRTWVTAATTQGPNH